MSIVRIEQLGKAYKHYASRWARLREWLPFTHAPRHTPHWVLRDISFTVEPGEAVGIIGENGAGKSTLLKIITGTSQRTEGSIAITGKVAALLELGMGFHPDFTGRQNVFMAGQIMGISTEEITQLMPQIEAFADIGTYIDEPIRVYSSGMQMRLAFAVATAKRPELLIVDEALSVGDAHFQHKSFRRIREFRAAGTTLLFVSHDLSAVKSICDKVIWIDQGKIRAMGDPKTVIDAYSTAIYAKHQDTSSAEASPVIAAETTKTTVAPAPITPANTEGWRDCRADFINNSNLRNDIEAFRFDPSAPRWGTGSATISGIHLEDVHGNPLQWIVGGESVVVHIHAAANSALDDAMMGFIVRDRLGQPLFGDNTFITYMDRPIRVEAGKKFSARFEFNMPLLPAGVYNLAAAIATGTQRDHVIHDWLDNALYFESHNAGLTQGLVGIPIKNISLTVL